MLHHLLPGQHHGGVFLVLPSQLARMHPGWGVSFYCSLFQGWAWLQGVCSGFSMLWDRGGDVRVLLPCITCLVVLGCVLPRARCCLGAALRGLGAVWFLKCVPAEELPCRDLSVGVGGSVTGGKCPLASAPLLPGCCSGQELGPCRCLCCGAGLPAAPATVGFNPNLIRSNSQVPGSFGPEESRQTNHSCWFFVWFLFFNNCC